MVAGCKAALRCVWLLVLVVGPLWAQGGPGGPQGVADAASREELLAAIQQLQKLVAAQNQELESQRAALRTHQEQLARLEKLLLRLTQGGDAQLTAAAQASPQQTPQEQASNSVELLENQIDAVAAGQMELNGRVSKLQSDFTAAQQATEARVNGIGNFRWTGDVRLRYEPFFQGGGAITRHRERARARLNVTAKITEELSGGVSLASGALDDVNSSNQSLTGFFTRKSIGFDRYYLTYKPKWLKSFTFTGGKAAYPWQRTGLTFDGDINPEGFSQTLSFSRQSGPLENVTLVAFQLPFNEVSGGHDSFMGGGQIQTHWRLSERVKVHLYAAGINVHRADPIAVAIANGDLSPSLSNSNLFRRDTDGDVVGYVSKFLYLDLIAVLNYDLHPRWPLEAQFNVVNNTRAANGERTGYWAELTLGRLQNAGDVQFGYTFVRIERDAVIGAFNESDLRSATNVRNHRLGLGYQSHKNLSLNYTLWVGRLASPELTGSLAAPNFRAACTTAPFTGCQDSYLKRMQFDAIFKF